MKLLTFLIEIFMQKNCDDFVKRLYCKLDQNNTAIIVVTLNNTILSKI